MSRIKRRTVGQTVLVLALSGLAAIVGGRLFSLYTGPWTVFARPMRQFLQAAAAHDSARLRQLSESEAVVQRTLAAANQRPQQVDLDHLKVISGERVGDTTRITFHHAACSGDLLVVTFRGSGSRARVQDSGLPCPAP